MKSHIQASITGACPKSRKSNFLLQNNVSVRNQGNGIRVTIDGKMVCTNQGTGINLPVNNNVEN